MEHKAARVHLRWGDGDAARRYLDAAGAALGDQGAAGLRARIAADRSLASAGLGETQAAELCERIGDRHRQAALHNTIADLLHAAGRDDEAMTHLTRAVELFAEIGTEAGHEPEIWKLVDW